jgi:hypothetical protein
MEGTGFRVRGEERIRNKENQESSSVPAYIAFFVIKKGK